MFVADVLRLVDRVVAEKQDVEPAAWGPGPRMPFPCYACSKLDGRDWRVVKIDRIQRVLHVRCSATAAATRTLTRPRVEDPASREPARRCIGCQEPLPPDSGLRIWCRRCLTTKSATRRAKDIGWWS